MPFPFDLYVVLSGDDAQLEHVLAAIRSAPRGRLGVQARWKDAPDALVLSRTSRLLDAASRSAAPVLVSSRPDLARAAGAGGVHLPEAALRVEEARGSLGDGLVGASCHDLAGVERRIEEGADFVTLGPLGEVPGKNAPLSNEVFERVVRAARVPVFALGGVRAPSDVERVLRLGAHGIAVERAIASAPDPREALETLVRAIDAARARLQ